MVWCFKYTKHFVIHAGYWIEVRSFSHGETCCDIPAKPFWAIEPWLVTDLRFSGASEPHGTILVSREPMEVARRSTVAGVECLQDGAGLEEVEVRGVGQPTPLDQTGPHDAFGANARVEVVPDDGRVLVDHSVDELVREHGRSLSVEDDGDLVDVVDPRGGVVLVFEDLCQGGR